jgi:catalase
MEASTTNHHALPINDPSCRVHNDLFIVHMHHSSPVVVHQEFMASNTSTIADPDYTFIRVDLG